MLRVRLRASGRAAHSSFPELGESAIDKLIDALMVLRGVALPEDPILGRTHYTVGLIEGGVAPNVVSPHASAELLFRIVGDGAPVRAALHVIETLVAVEPVHSTSRPCGCTRCRASRRRSSFRTPRTSRSADAVGHASCRLLGPGSIHVAHTDDEHVAIDELHHAIEASSLQDRVAMPLALRVRMTLGKLVR